MSTSTDTTVPTPGGNFTGKEFEEALLKAAETLETRGHLTMGRYGVQASVFGGKTMAVQSLPDFEGVTSMGVQFICEAKTVQTNCLPMHTKFMKKRQVTFMVKRADYSVPCFFICLHRERVLKVHTVSARTVVYPVHRKMPWVQECLLAYREKREPQGSIPPEMGFEIDWWIPTNSKHARPDLMAAVEKTRNLIISLNYQ